MRGARDIVMDGYSTQPRIECPLNCGPVRQLHRHEHAFAQRHQHHIVTHILADYDREQAGEH